MKLFLKLFYAKQYSVTENNNVLTSSTNPITNQYLSNIEFMKYDIKRIIFKLDPNKAPGHDMIINAIFKTFLIFFFKFAYDVEYFNMTGKRKLYSSLKKVRNKTSNNIIQCL